MGTVACERAQFDVRLMHPSRHAQSPLPSVYFSDARTRISVSNHSQARFALHRPRSHSTIILSLTTVTARGQRGCPPSTRTLPCPMPTAPRANHTPARRTRTVRATTCPAGHQMPDTIFIYICASSSFPRPQNQPGYVCVALNRRRPCGGTLCARRVGLLNA